MLWYPDGEPQLYTNYYQGAPHGRFVGWYTNGRVVYNIVLNRGKLGGDFLYDQEESRREAEVDNTEPEGTDND
jgi:antitoxin component YwqK of YwqJK toxin-antitoxin module